MKISSATAEAAIAPARGARGRPPRISRDAILDAAVAQLERDPATPLSLNGVARATGVAAMAIYTYFSGKDDLLQAVTERLLAGLRCSIPPAASAPDKLRAWAHAMRAHFLCHPQLIHMLIWEGGNMSVGWLRRALVVTDMLEELGLSGEQLGTTTLWIWHVVMGAINIEIRDRSIPQFLAAEEFAKLDPEIKRRFLPIGQVQAMPGHAAIFFDYQIERMLDALGVMAAEVVRRKRVPAARSTKKRK